MASGSSKHHLGGLGHRLGDRPGPALLASTPRVIGIVPGDAKHEAVGLPRWAIRIGRRTAGVVADMVGKKKLAYDVWGYAVNVAA